MKVFLATKNSHKIKEVESIFTSIAEDFKLHYDESFLDVEETEETLEGNALLKAKKGYEHAGMPTVADDTGLFVEALDGKPGVKSKRYYSEDATDEENIHYLLSSLEGSTNRYAHFKTVVCFFDGKDSIFKEGVLKGEISVTPSGENGFGYDSIFLYNQRTLAEMNADEKNAISHRKVAFTKIAKTIKLR